ncbi:MAG: DUF2232 domain-containing protein [Gemmatimonadales bacterium]
MRPRVTLGAALTLGLFVLSGPAPFVLLPLGLLILLSRPDRLALWIWLAGCTLWTELWLASPGGIAGQTLKAWVVLAAGIFVLLALHPTRRAFDAALGAALGATCGVLVWLTAFRIPLSQVAGDGLRTVWDIYRQMGDALPPFRDAANDAADSASMLATIFPAGVILFGLGGLLLAWRWYHLLVTEPVGAPAGPFREFRFSDHLIWLLVAGMAGTVAQLSGLLPIGTIWPANLLVLAGALYGARGLAVLWSSIAGWPAPVLLLAGTAVLFLAPFAFTGLLGVGLADTWLDFRRRAAAASGE